MVRVRGGPAALPGVALDHTLAVSSGCKPVMWFWQAGDTPEASLPRNVEPEPWIAVG